LPLLRFRCGSELRGGDPATQAVYHLATSEMSGGEAEGELTTDGSVIESPASLTTDADADSATTQLSGLFVECVGSNDGVMGPQEVSGRSSCRLGWVRVRGGCAEREVRATVEGSTQDTVSQGRGPLFFCIPCAVASACCLCCSFNWSWKGLAGRWMKRRQVLCWSLWTETKVSLMFTLLPLAHSSCLSVNGYLLIGEGGGGEYELGESVVLSCPWSCCSFVSSSVAWLGGFDWWCVYTGMERHGVRTKQRTLAHSIALHY
jgi:hypothetical protein